MTNAGTVIAAYALTFGAVAVYAVWVLRRAKTLGQGLGIGRPPPDSPPEATRS